MGFLSSHPATQDRIDHLTSQASLTSNDYLNFDQEFKQLQSHVQQFVTENNLESETDAEALIKSDTELDRPQNPS